MNFCEQVNFRQIYPHILEKKSISALNQPFSCIFAQICVVENFRSDKAAAVAAGGV